MMPFPDSENFWGAVRRPARMQRSLARWAAFSLAAACSVVGATESGHAGNGLRLVQAMSPEKAGEKVYLTQDQNTQDQSIPDLTARHRPESEHWADQAKRASRTSLPVWELGVGLSAITLPDYRGSDRQRQYLLPFPVFVYRSPQLHVDRSGIRADLWDDKRFELDLSVGATAPVRTDATGARSGMPRLRALFELGPRLQIHLWSANEGKTRLKAALPLRYAMQLGRLRQAGWVFSPSLNLQVDDVLGFRGWQFSTWAGPIFATKDYHQYYYRVGPEHATARRPAYEASGGYGGSQFALSLNKRYPEYWVAGYVRADFLKGARFEDSPLVRRRSNVTAGLVFGWLFMRSTERVAQSD